MSTPEKNISGWLWDKATFGNISSAVGFGFAIYGAIDSKSQWANLNARLDQIQKGIEEIKVRVDNVYGQVKESQLLTATVQAENDIDAWFRSFTALLELTLATPPDLERIKKDRKKLIGQLEKCPEHLREIHAALMGTKSSLEGPYMKLFVEDVIKMGSRQPRTQSEYFYAVSRFERWLAIQRKGLILLGNLEKHKDPNASVSKIVQKLIPDSHARDPTDRLVPRIKLQAEKSAQSLKGVEEYYRRPVTGGEPLTHFFTFGINTCDAEDVFYLDTNVIEADPGKIVVGLQLYKKGDRLAVRITQAAFTNGIVSQEIPEGTTKENAEANANALELINKERVKELIREYGDDATRHNTKNEIARRLPPLYINLTTVEVPRQEVITGAKLYLRDNWICIGIQAAKLYPSWTEVDESSRHWIDSPAPPGNAQEDKDFFAIRGTCKYINLYAVVPTPLAPLRAVRFWRHDTDGAYRLNLEVKTGLCAIEDVWEQYDICRPPVFTGGAKLLSEGHTGKVRLRDSKGFCLGFAGGAEQGRDFVFDLTRPEPELIQFEYEAGGGYEGGTLAFLSSFSNWDNSIGGVPKRISHDDRSFEWFPLENGLVLLKIGGKFLRRAGTPGYGNKFYADQDSPDTAERFQITAA